MNIIPKKYRQIVLAIAAFLLFDLGVLVLNFYTSFQISSDAVAINLAGRQRMLSQRMTKSLVTIDLQTMQGKPDDNALKELRTTVDLFNSTLDAFAHGGTVLGGNNRPVTLQPVRAAGQAILSQSDTLWQPYLDAIQSALSHSPIDATQLHAAVQIGLERNVKLLGLMNDLTTQLEREASAKAQRLRLIQTIGIALALLNFGFILFHFLRQLRESDQIIEAAQQETQEILSTVKEGLFLLGPDLRIGNQVSASLPSILGDKAQPGAPLLTVLENRLNPEVLQATRDYIELLFGERVKENLMRDLNPINLVAIQDGQGRGATDTRYLSVQFNRVLVQGKISHLLVTVQEVSEQIRLQQELEAVTSRTHGEVEALLKLLSIDNASLMHYLDQAQQTLEEINGQLQSSQTSTQNHLLLINGIFRRVHGLKGDAAMLGLDIFEQMAGEFEAVLRQLREQPRIEGHDLVSIPLKIDAFLERLHSVRDLVLRMNHNAADSRSVTAHAKHLDQLAQRIARDQGKLLTLQTDLALLEQLPEKTQTTLNAIAVQLLRNAATHGIEPPDERIGRAKNEAGTIEISLLRPADDEFALKVRDDGRGIDPEQIRDKLIRSGRYTPEQVAQWDQRQIVMQIFEPGFSTLDHANRDAGHGVGLDVVKEQVANLGGRLRISSVPHKNTEFLIRFTV
ncbi:ATP-binding protein [Halothiobacillus sp. DCM-1]|uniref:ATP-binding protein n=1 Tax=Halothiobacillus sp. DCM-1 TaxID=3112558 RepID=UPI00324F8C90